MTHLVGPHDVMTFSGRPFNVIDVDRDEIRVTDIAHQLSLITRFNGATKSLSSVAEHAVLTHDLCVRDYGECDLSFACLNHDDAEAYLGEMTRAVKRLCPEYQRVEDNLLAEIMATFEIPWTDTVHHFVKIYDDMACRAEAHSQLVGSGDNFNWGDVPLVLDAHTVPYLPKAAETLFLNRFQRYRSV